MAKTAHKKEVKTLPKRTQDKKKKLPRGYKECGNCKRLLHIHKYVCDGCGYKHDMKKKKVDILKNLNKVTPKLLRSLIELNDFNDLSELRPNHQPFDKLVAPPAQLSVPQESKRRRSSKAHGSSQNSSQFTWTTLETRGYFLKMKPSLTCLCPVLDGILVAQGIQKFAVRNQSEKITLKVYNLNSFHRLGQIYIGKACLYYFQNRKLSHKIEVSEHVMGLKQISNRVGILTGRGTILISDLEVGSKSQEDKVVNADNTLQIKAGYQDQITAFQWLKTHSSQEITFLAAGTLLGHLYIYKIENKESQLERFISNAHFEAITCIAECPLGNQEECLFASGSYDGTISIWSLNQKQPIYSVQASNRKIYSLVWDPGAKFIFVLRDENQDSGVLACFFAIFKNDESVALSDQIDFRLIRNALNCKILHNDQSTQFCLLDSYQCLLRIMEVEELRKNSLKRKKVKKEEDQTVLKLTFADQSMKVSEMEIDEQSKTEPKLSEERLQLPQIVDACMSKIAGKDVFWGITYSGFLFEINRV